MKKLWKFLKALGTFLALGLFLVFIVVNVLAELFPTLFDHWMHTVLLILDLPFFIGIIVHFIKENKSNRNSKKK